MVSNYNHLQLVLFYIHNIIGVVFINLEVVKTTPISIFIVLLIISITLYAKRRWYMKTIKTPTKQCLFKTKINSLLED